MGCDNCGSFEFERFRMMSLEFDVAAANKLVTPDRHVRVVPEKFLRSLGLPLDEEKCLNCSDPVSKCVCGKKSFHVAMVGINEAHLSHLQDTERPGVIAVVLWKSKNGPEYSSILIDGNHRAVRAYREGREFQAIILTPHETWEIMSGAEKAVVNPNTKAGKAKLKRMGYTQ